MCRRRSDSPSAFLFLSDIVPFCGVVTRACNGVISCWYWCYLVLVMGLLARRAGARRSIRGQNYSLPSVRYYSPLSEPLLHQAHFPPIYQPENILIPNGLRLRDRRNGTLAIKNKKTHNDMIYTIKLIVHTY